MITKTAHITCAVFHYPRKPNEHTFTASKHPYDQPKLKSMPLREQPAYRVTQNANACNQTELMAAVIGGAKQIEIAQDLMAHFNNDIRRLYQAHPAELAKVKGINQATAVRIKAALNLGLRLSQPAEERITINSPADAAALVQSEMALLEKEHLRVLLLDRRNRVLDIIEVYQGSVSSRRCASAKFSRLQSAAMPPRSLLSTTIHHPTQLLRPMMSLSPARWCRQASCLTLVFSITS